MKTNEGFENFGPHPHVVWLDPYIFYLNFVLMCSEEKKNIKKIWKRNKKHSTRSIDWMDEPEFKWHGTAEPNPARF